MFSVRIGAGCGEDILNNRNSKQLQGSGNKPGKITSPAHKQSFARIRLFDAMRANNHVANCNCALPVLTNSKSSVFLAFHGNQNHLHLE